MVALTPLNRRDALRLGGGAAMAVPMLGSLAGCGKPKAVEHEIDIVMTQGMTGLVVQEIAESQGYFREFDVVPKVTLVSDGAKCVAALLSGSAKLCAWSGFNQLMPAIEKGAKIKILAGALNLPSVCMYSARDDIRSVKDLEGKVLGIGAAGSVLHQMTALILQKQGVDVSKVQFRNVGSMIDVLKATIAKTVDAGLGDVDVFDQQAKMGIHALPDGMAWKDIPEYTNQGTYASDAAIRDHREVIVRTLAAYAKAYRFISGPSSREAFLAAREKLTSQKDQTSSITQWNWIQANQPYATDLTLSDERINFVQKLNMQFEIQKRQLTVSELADMSLARDAVKKLG